MQAATVNNLIVLSELLAMVRGHDNQRRVPLAARFELTENRAYSLVRPGDVELIELPRNLMKIGRQQHRRIEERLEILRADALG